MNDIAEMLGPIPRWFVMFTGEGKRKHWVDWLSPLGFQHVLAFAYDAGGQRWIVYDVHRIGTVITALPSNQFDIWLPTMLRGGAKVLAVDVRSRPRVWWRFGFACVGAVRHLVGASSRAWRPIGLWRDLRRAGAEECFRPEVS